MRLYEGFAGLTALVAGTDRSIGERIAADLAGTEATVSGARHPETATATDRRAVEPDVIAGATVAAALGRVGEEAGSTCW